MRFHVTDEIPYPRDEVFDALCNHMPDMVEFLPNVERIDVKSRKEQDDVVELVNLWKGNTEIPRVLSGFIKPEMLTWTDHASWDRDTFKCEWHNIINALPDAVTAKGITTLVDEGDDTVLEISGEFTVHPERLPRGMSLMGRTIKPAIEKLIIGLLKPNLKQQAVAVREYLDENG